MQPLREKHQIIHVIGSLDLVQTLFADRLFDQLNLWNVDVVHSVRGRPSMIFDAKCKAASASGASPNADHYQILAYCTALGVPRAWLVYAGAGQPRSRRVLNMGVSAGSFSGTGGFAGAGG